MTDQSVEEDSKKQKLNEQQRRAFYAVLLAFRAETLSSGNVKHFSLLVIISLCLLLLRVCLGVSSEEDSDHREADERVEYSARNSRLF